MDQFECNAEAAPVAISFGNDFLMYVSDWGVHRIIIYENGHPIKSMSIHGQENGVNREEGYKCPTGIIVQYELL